MYLTCQYASTYKNTLVKQGGRILNENKNNIYRAIIASQVIIYEDMQAKLKLAAVNVVAFQ